MSSNLVTPYLQYLAWFIVLDGPYLRDPRGIRSMQPRAELSFFCSTWNSYCTWESFLTNPVFITSEWFLTRKITSPNWILFPSHDRHTRTWLGHSHCPDQTLLFPLTYFWFTSFCFCFEISQGATQKQMSQVKSIQLHFFCFSSVYWKCYFQAKRALP